MCVDFSVFCYFSIFCAGVVIVAKSISRKSLRRLVSTSNLNTITLNWIDRVGALRNVFAKGEEGAKLLNVLT